MKPNEADFICNRIEMGCGSTYDFLQLEMLEFKGIKPLFYNVDKKSMVVKRYEKAKNKNTDSKARNGTQK